MLPTIFEKSKIFSYLVRKACFRGKKAPSTPLRACPEEFEGMKKDSGVSHPLRESQKTEFENLLKNPRLFVFTP